MSLRVSLFFLSLALRSCSPSPHALDCLQLHCFYLLGFFFARLTDFRWFMGEFPVFVIFFSSLFAASSLFLLQIEEAHYIKPRLFRRFLKETKIQRLVIHLGPFCTRKLFPFSEVVAKNLAEQRRAMQLRFFFPPPDAFEAASVHMSKSHPPK